jgi:GWxTD domain-containing protein
MILLRALCALACLLAAGTASAQAPELPLQLDVDYATFQYDEATSLVETYLAFEASSLPYVRAVVGDGYEVALPVVVALRRASAGGPPQASDALAFADTLALRFGVPDTTGLVQGQYFVQQVRAAVAPGEYELEVLVPGDSASARPDFRATPGDITVPDFTAAGTSGRVMLSDITLASAIGRTDDRAATFYKNGLLVQPNPNSLFGQGLPSLYYYAEAYGLDAAVDGDYTLFAYLAASNVAAPMEDYQRRSVRPAQPNEVIAGQFDLREMPSGSYFLRLALLDENNEALAEQSRKFYVYNPNVAAPVAAAADLSYESNLYAVMPEAEIDENLRHADVIATGRERDQMRRLTVLDAKRDFLVEFWRKRDEAPATPINETRVRFYERVQYASDRYTNSQQEGWTTDRGRVVLKYGYPSQVDPTLFDSESLPHETWTYDNIPGSGQSLFVFVDRLGFGDFELIHSTVTGEVSVPDWRQQLRR